MYLVTYHSFIRSISKFLLIWRGGIPTLCLGHEIDALRERCLVREINYTILAHYVAANMKKALTSASAPAHVLFPRIATRFSAPEIQDP